MTASDFSPAEARRLAVIEVTADAPEALRERIARELCAARSEVPWDAQVGWQRRHYRRMADAAIRVVTEDARQ